MYPGTMRQGRACETTITRSPRGQGQHATAASPSPSPPHLTTTCRQGRRRCCLGRRRRRRGGCGKDQGNEGTGGTGKLRARRGAGHCAGPRGARRGAVDAGRGQRAECVTCRLAARLGLRVSGVAQLLAHGPHIMAGKRRPPPQAGRESALRLGGCAGAVHGGLPWKGRGGRRITYGRPQGQGPCNRRRWREGRRGRRPWHLQPA